MNPLKIIIGAGATKIDGWLSTQQSDLDVLDEETWRARFSVASIRNILAEHVWEHLSIEEGLIAAKLCFKYLQEGGLARIAVPDAYFRNAWYQNMVKVGGPGPKDHPAATHKVLYDYKSLVELFRAAGFKVELLEYCDEEGVFHHAYWNTEDGYIGRSYRYDTRNSGDALGMVSLIIDAKKERIIKYDSRPLQSAKALDRRHVSRMDRGDTV